MATESWKPGTTLSLKTVTKEELEAEEARAKAVFGKLRVMLEEEPFKVEFAQAVRLLQRMEPNRSAVGYFVPPGSEAVRFTVKNSLSFPPSQLYSLERRKDGQLELVVQFMGVCAAVTVMPHAYTEYLLTLLKDKDTGMADFFDLFNHRMISFFYRGWEKYRLFVGFEAGHADSLSPRIKDFLGLGTLGLAGRTTLPDQAFIAYSGLLSRHTRSAGGLKQILEDYFGVSVTIVQFAGTWRFLPQQDQTIFTGSNVASERLGVGTVVGSEVWDHHGRIRIRIGPLGFDRYVSFLPGASAHRDLEEWVRFYSSGQYEAEVQLILNKEEAPPCELGLRGPTGPRLGLASWLKTKSLLLDPGDALFLLN